MVRLWAFFEASRSSSIPPTKKQASFKRPRSARSANGPSSSPIEARTFSAEARTCCSRSAALRRLSPLTSSKCVNTSSSLLELPEVIISFMAATGAACIGWTALSTSTMASVDSIRRVSEVEMAATDLGVCPRPSPSRSTSLGCCPPFQAGRNSPDTRTPFTSGVSSRPKRGEWLLEKRVTVLMKVARSSVSHDHDCGQPCLLRRTVPSVSSEKRSSTSSMSSSLMRWNSSSSRSRRSSSSSNSSSTTR